MAKIFKGYIPSKGKAPLSSVKNRENWLSEPPNEGDYVGILYEDYIQLDFDEEETAKIALQIVNDLKLRCDILKTNRGLHIYFKNDAEFVKSQSVGIFTAIGLKADIGLGSKDRVVPIRLTKDIETLRIVDGKEVTCVVPRTFEREFIQTYEELDVLPAFFRPISKSDYNLAESDTRNQSLFNYILTLQYHNFNREEVRKTIKLINKYILKEPLSDKEVDIITREESFSEELFFTEDGKFLHDRFGNYMLTNSNILMIDRQPHIYTDKSLYSNDPLEFEKQMIKKIPHLKDTQRKEVYKFIALKCSKEGEFADAKFIGLKNTILDLETMEEIPYSPKWVINNRINFEYNPNAYHEIMDKTLNKVCCNDVEIRTLLEEMIGYSLYRANTMQTCFILTGEGSNGKSTILNCIKKLIGKGNYTSLDLRELEDTFKPSELYNKLANIGDDISAKYLENSSVFKKVVTGESFMVQRKYAQPFELECYATQIFCANTLPQVNDKSDGFGRRITIIPFNAKFNRTDADFDPFIEQKLMSDDAIEYLLKLAIDGLKRVITEKKFTKSQKGESEKTEYIKSNNNILEYLEDVMPEIENNAVNDCYLQYEVWCAKNSCQPVKKLNFTKEIKKQLGLESVPSYIDGKTIRVYKKIDKC